MGAPTSNSGDARVADHKLHHKLRGGQVVKQHHIIAGPPPPSPVPSLESGSNCNQSRYHASTAGGQNSHGGLRISCCHSSKGKECSSNSAPESSLYPKAVVRSHCGSSGHYQLHHAQVNHTSTTGAAAGMVGTSQSEDALLRVAVPFRNNPALRYS